MGKKEDMKLRGHGRGVGMDLGAVKGSNVYVGEHN